MKINQAQILGPRTLVSFIKQQKFKDCGDKFERFNELASKKFERVVRLSFHSDKYGKDVSTLELPCMVFAVLTLRKMVRAMEEVQFNRKQFLEDIKYKSQQITAKNNFSPSTAERFYQSVAYALTDPNQFFDLFKLHNKYIYELVNMCAEVKTKEFEEIEHYAPEQMNKISAIMKEKIFFIDYDENKEALDNVSADYRYLYLLRAKGFYFMLVKLQDITLLKNGVVGHQELAQIFQIEHQLAEEVVKQSKVPSTQDLIQVKQKQGQSPKKQEYSQINLITNDSPLKHVNTTTVSLLKSSTLFPEEVKCKICCKTFSEFNTLYWNYANYCLECVVSPKVDISFVPSSVIKKYLKSMKYNANEPYHVICPECQSQTTIKNYRVEDKVKQFQCKSCLKVICIEHQSMILACFCYCMNCRKRTISIEGQFQKYCGICKVRLCQVCNYKGTQDCQCICKSCGDFGLVDHECKGFCHGCQGKDLMLMPCPCGKKLCAMCSFKNFDPQESICMKANYY